MSNKPTIKIWANDEVEEIILGKKTRMSNQPTIKIWADEVEETVSDEVEERKASKEKMKSDSRENSSSRKRYKPSNDQKPKVPRKPLEVETDPSILQRRQKQIDYGKNTVGYHNYMQQVPLDKRTREHPKTPDKYTKYSRRSWDTLIKMWRRKLHEYDTSGHKSSGMNDIDDDDDDEEEEENDEDDKSDN